MKKSLLYLLPALTTFAAIAQNDACADAIMLVPSPDCIPISGSFAETTVSDAVSYDCSPNASQDVWYYFTATSNEISIFLNNSPTNSMAIYTASCDGDFFSCSFASGPPSGTGTGSTLFVSGEVYYIRVVNSDPEPSSATFTICVQGPAPLKAPDAATGHPEVYPNPVEEILTVTGMGTTASFQLYNSLGQLVKKGNLISGNIPMQDVSSGIYQLQLNDVNGFSQTKKIIKK